MNLFEKFIASVSPSTALRRERDRQALQMFQQHGQARSARGFEAAARGRRTDGWQTFYQLPWDEISRDLPTLRARAIDMANNNPWAQKALKVIANNTVGTGIVPALPSGRIRNLWKQWAESTDCDHSDLHNFYGLQWQVMHTMAKSGECLVIRKRSRDGFGFRLQVLEGVYLDQGKNYSSIGANTENYIIDGVEFDTNGRRVAYWLYDVNPLIYQGVSNRIPAEDVIHLFDVLRPGQVRGVPFGVASMLRLRDFDEYEDAQLLRQKIAACYTVFVRDAVDVDRPSQKADQDSLPDAIEPGNIELLPPGKDITFANPPGADGYGEYSRNQLLAISAGYEVPYEALTNDYSNVNFSSSRMSWLEFHRSVSRYQQQIIITRFCNRVWQWFGEYAVLWGAAKKPVTRWTPPRRGMIDPVKEVQGMLEAARGGLTPWSDAVREMGYDPDDVIAEMKQYNEKLDAANVKVTADPRYYPLRSGPLQDTTGSKQVDPKK